MKAKNIYLSEEMLQKIQSEIDVTGQSFTGYVRKALMYYCNTAGPLSTSLSYDAVIAHTEQIAILSNQIHQYILAVAEKDLYSDCLPDSIVIQNQLQQLIDAEVELTQQMMNK
jgi:hypothetical protein